MASYRNWVDVRSRLPDTAGDYAVWHACGIGGKMGAAFFNGEKFPDTPKIFEWMDGYKDA